MTISDPLTDSGTRPPLWFRVPNEFIPIDPDEPAESRIDRIIDESAHLPGIDQAQQLHLVYAQETIHQQLAGAGAVYAAHCVVRSENTPRLATALFAVLVNEVPGLEDQTMPVLARSMSEPGSPVEVLLAEYPAGQVIARGEQLLVQWNGTSQSMRQAQVLFQMPDQRRLATLSISSAHLADWNDFVAILNEIAKTVTFTDPETVSPSPSIGNILSGGL